MSELQVVEEILIDEYLQSGMCPFCNQKTIDERASFYFIYCHNCYEHIEKKFYYSVLYSVKRIMDDDIPF